jgi:hypothetical protein
VEAEAQAAGAEQERDQDGGHRLHYLQVLSACEMHAP